MKKSIALYMLMLLCLEVNGQLFSDRSNLFAGFQTGVFAGGELFNHQGTVAPSFYSNFSHNYGYVLKQSVVLSPCYSAGLKVTMLYSENWQSDRYSSYKGAESKILAVLPTLEVHNKFSHYGLFNRLKLYADIAPVFGWSNTSIKSDIFYIKGNVEVNEVFIHDHFFVGVNAGIGSEFAFTNSFGVFVDLSVQEAFFRHPFFVDNRYTLFAANFGVRINLIKHKRFIY